MTRQATTVIGRYKYCPHCGVADPFTLSAKWPHGKCRSCNAVMSDARPIVAVAMFVHRECVYIGYRGKGDRAGFLTLPSGFTEEHNENAAVAAAVANPEAQLGFFNQVDGESIGDAAFAELEEEMGYVGPALKARICGEAFATNRHERLVFVHLVVADSQYLDADPTDWFSKAAIKTPGELHSGHWTTFRGLPEQEKWAFPIFYRALVYFKANPFPLRPHNVRTYLPKS